MGMKVLKEEPVAYPKAKTILEEREKQKELGYEQKSSIEHLREFSKLDEKKAETLWGELASVEKLRDVLIAKIINTLPKTKDELKMLFQKDRIDLSEDESEKIVQIVAKCV